MSIILREQHTIFRKNSSKNALKVIYRLNRAGHEAYLVGEGDRDLLLDKKPKDFDVTISTTPEQIYKIFRNFRLVGHRFRLAHIMLRSELIKVATFRGYREVSFTNHAVSQCDQNGMFSYDNTFGPIEEDTQRRDFTINSLYYSATDFTVRNYVGDMQDLKRGIIRLIGRPEIRYHEDPVRILRVVRFSAKLNMQISPETAKSIPYLSGLINEVPPARLFEEAVLKLLQAGCGYETCNLLNECNLLQLLFPTIVRYFIENGDSPVEHMISQVFRNTDNCVHNDVYTNSAFLFSAIFWFPLLETTRKIVQERKLVYYDVFIMASSDTINASCHALAIPKRITALVRDIWKLQLWISHYQNGYNRNLLEYQKIRAVYDLLILCAEIERNKDLQNLVLWWGEFQALISPKQRNMSNNLDNNRIDVTSSHYYCLHNNRTQNCE